MVRARYADLAEMYLADQEYTPGTLVKFGGLREITITNQSHDVGIAGVISTDPSYVMNSVIEGQYPLAVALTGRVPVRVKGPVSKGDLIVSDHESGVGAKMQEQLYRPGCIVGKSLEDHNEDTVKTIEIAVGRY